jgi:hypothetical protein
VRKRRSLRFEELREVAGRVLDERLAPAIALDDTTAERATGRGEAGDRPVEVVEFELEPGPPTRRRRER